MDNGSILTNTARGFCIAWFSGRNPELASRYLAADVQFTGTGENENVLGRQALTEYIRQDIAESRTPFEIEFYSEQEHYITADVGTSVLEFRMVNIDYNWRGNVSITLSRTGDGEDTSGQDEVGASGGTRWEIRQLHFSIPTPCQEHDRHYPPSLVKKHLNDMRHELLASSIAGGLLGAYHEEGYPFYYINDRMLTYLGYGSEAEFIEDNRGCIINCIHPEDRQMVASELDYQLAEQDRYVIEYRMRKKNGSYFYAHEMGRSIETEDGRKALLAVSVDVSSERLEREQNEVLVNALNGGIVICRIEGDCFSPTYMSPHVGRMAGYAKAELLGLISTDILSTVYPEDREKLLSILNSALHEDESRELTYRILHKDGHYIWITAIFRRMEGEQGVPLLHCLFMSQSQQFELQNTIIDGSDTGTYVVDPETNEIYLANRAAFQILDKPVSDYFGKKCHDLFGGPDMPCEHCNLNDENYQPQELKLPHSGKTITVDAKKALWLNKHVVIKYLHDITERKNTEEALRLGEERLTAALEHAGVHFWEYDMLQGIGYMGKTLQRMYHLPRTMEQYPQSFIETGLLHPDDIENYLQMSEKLKAGEPNVMLEFRMREPDGEYVWQLAHCTNSFDEEGKPVRAFATFESIEQYKELEERFAIAARLAGIRIWTMDIPNRLVQLKYNDTQDLTSIRMVSCESRERLMESGLFHPDDLTTLWEYTQKMFEGIEGVPFRVRLRIDEIYRWYICSYTVVQSKGGVPVKVLGSFTDIHEQVLLEQRFEQEIAYAAGLQGPNLITKVQSNVTKGTIDLYQGTSNTAVTSSGGNFEDAVRALARAAVDVEKQKQIVHLLDRKRLTNAFANGERFFSLEYERLASDGRIFWANSIFRNYQNPTTGDIMSFMYTYDINDQKLSEAIVARVVDTNFEYLTLFDVGTGIVERTIDKAGVILRPEAGKPYEQVMEDELRSLLLEDAGMSPAAAFHVGVIAEKLSEKETYSVSADIYDSRTNEPRCKLWVFNWFDPQHLRVLCSRSDITEANRQAQHQKEALFAALVAAKQASTAKSEFLSRMSHEIRTPMNAIIGMTAIAAKSIGNHEQTADCIRKIDISSRFLLSLINDILDMSRIESGKLLLRNSDIHFEEFIREINTICAPQATAKGVAYECTIGPNVAAYYQGDAMKLQQILVNILGNAVKFTPAGGQVSFHICQLKKTAQDALLRFIIKDTGIGMSKEFLPHLFDPFEQEASGITSAYGGTGLGLSISKNIIDLMGGKIRVGSVKGEGTEFQIDITLKVIEEEDPERTAPAAADVLNHSDNPSGLADIQYDFSGKRLLLVEDHPLNAEIAKLILEEVGFQVETAHNGLVAIEKFSSSPEWYYSSILMDIRMPLMDGLEASANIRQLPRPDAAVIPIIAMTADAFDEDADKCKAAGMNLHLAKPIDPPRLFGALHTLIAAQRES